MIKIIACVEFIGDNFKPGLAELEAKFSFTEKSEKGDVGISGAYKSKPIPYAFGRLKAPSEIPHYERILWLAQFLDDKIHIIREHKPDNIYFEIGYFHDGQCNCELTVNEIKAIAKLEIPYSFSTYEVDCLDEII
jgi:hypothetical protein